MKAYRTIVPTLLFLAIAVSALPAWGAEGKEVVNINKATESQLALLPRVGPALAARIVEFREANGEFKSPEDLILVRGIGEKTFELMKPYVVTSGETTLSAKVRLSRTQKPDSDSDSDG